MGRVRNIVIHHREEFEEQLILELIKNKISYVQIEHEFHFLDKIYRFYDVEEIKQSALLPNLNDIQFVGDFSSLDHQISQYSLLEMEKSIEYVPVPINDGQHDNDLSTPKINKKKIKIQNRQVNQIVNKK